METTQIPACGSHRGEQKQSIAIKRSDRDPLSQQLPCVKGILKPEVKVGNRLIRGFLHAAPPRAWATRRKIPPKDATALSTPGENSQGTSTRTAAPNMLIDGGSSREDRTGWSRSRDRATIDWEDDAVYHEPHARCRGD
ncbi:hypothetical protein B2J93_4489 [Marssonina coronariae]|uniref:Uncharacterized protein n=1 Tax=Diplocarpon coronariae TaxID=2795749 RepID=A0A218YTA8_9HELO|nr:hypothetical protein B2J93_4489 [Marssonina coronariae]